MGIATDDTVTLDDASGGALPGMGDGDVGDQSDGGTAKSGSNGDSSGGNDSGDGDGDGDLGMGGETAGGGASSGGSGAHLGGTGGMTQIGGGGTGGGGTGGGGTDGSGGDSAGGGSSSTGGSGGGGNAVCDVSNELCGALVDSMIHRYSFDGSGSMVIDSIGDADGAVYGTTISDGHVVLDGLNDYVALPSGLISALPNASFEIWFVWQGGPAWQRLFEFGERDFFTSPDSYLFATPEAGGSIPSQNALGAGLRHVGGGERQLRTSEFTATNVMTHVALIADDTSDRLTLYKNGQLVAYLDVAVSLNGINDEVAYLGRSLFADDPRFQGEITEFRIYSEVLSDEAIAKSNDLGPDAVFTMTN